jgi:hypothetical protein
VRDSDNDNARIGNVDNGLWKGVEGYVTSSRRDSRKKPRTAREWHLLDQLERVAELGEKSLPKPTVRVSYHAADSSNSRAAASRTSTTTKAGACSRESVVRAQGARRPVTKALYATSDLHGPCFGRAGLRRRFQAFGELECEASSFRLWERQSVVENGVRFTHSLAQHPDRCLGPSG